MRIGLLCYGFVNWGGGLDLIRYLVGTLISVASEGDLEVVLLLPRDDFLSRLKRFTFPFRSAASALVKGDWPKFKKHPGFSERYLRDTFSSFQGDAEMVFCNSDYLSQLKVATQLNLDLVVPCIIPPDVDFQLPWVGYIYDFQHVYMPHLFSEIEISKRNQEFQLMLNKAKHVMVNAQSVVDDVKRLYPNHRAQVHVLPFSPCPQLDWLNSGKDVRSQYGIAQAYFMVCNQFWRHKDHATVFRAMTEYAVKGGSCILICTGDKTDYLSLGYYDELLQLIRELGIAAHIKILGHIPKADQIALMKQAVAVVQPTLFEGGPGGGASYDAVSLGIPVIASDIPVNLEINVGNVSYFKAGDFHALAEIMQQYDSLPFVRLSSNDLWVQGLARRQACGRVLLDIFAKTMRAS